GLQSAISYDFSIAATNNIGTGPMSSALTVSTTVSNSLPSAPTAVIISKNTSNGMNRSRDPPRVGGEGFGFSVPTRVTGQSAWTSAATNVSGPTTNLSGLLSATSYDIQVIAVTTNGSGPPSVMVTAQTAPIVGAVTKITWNLAPTGTFVHGSGAVGMN